VLENQQSEQYEAMSKVANAHLMEWCWNLTGTSGKANFSGMPWSAKVDLREKDRAALMEAA